MFDVKTDLTKITLKPVLLPSGWVAADGHFLPGEWVYVDANDRVARITEDGIAHPNVYQIFTGSARMDTQFVGGLTVLVGVYEAETDWHAGTPALNDALTVNGDGETVERGELATTTTGGKIIVGWVTKAAVSGTNSMIFQRSTGWSVYPS